MSLPHLRGAGELCWSLLGWPREGGPPRRLPFKSICWNSERFSGRLCFSTSTTSRSVSSRTTRRFGTPWALASCRARSPCLCQELLAFLSEVVSRNLWFQVLRVPTALNVVADALSREEPLNTEWTLPELPWAAFADILRWAGPLEVDLIVSPVNHRLPRWVSPFPHSDALAVDCRSIDWNAFGSFYLFPPPVMLPQLLHLILSCRSRRVVVIPWRPYDPWFPPLLQGADDHLHLLVTPYQQTGGGDRVPLIRSLRTLDRTAFLRQVLGARYPARVVSTLLAAFRLLSQRQHDLAWRTFQAWLPVATCPIR